MMFRLIIFTAFVLVFVSCASKLPKTEQIATAPQDTVCVIDTLKITDSVFLKETESFKTLQKSVDSLIAKRETGKAIDMLKTQVQYYNNLDQLGFRTLQLANLLHQTGHSAEALAILETFAVYKPAINSWIDSANALYDKIVGTNREKTMQQMGSEKLEIINSLTAQIRNLKLTNANPMFIMDLADSLRSIAPGDSVLSWLEKQIPSQTESSDSFCEEQRKIAAANYATSRKNKVKANTLLTEAVEALDKCLAKTPSADMRKKVVKNREDLAKELRVE